MDILGIVGIPAIAVICYLVGMGLKAWTAFDDRGIPAFMGIAGLALGIAAYIWWPTVMPATDPLTAGAIGIVSGFTATTLDQIRRQSQKEASNEVQQ